MPMPPFVHPAVPALLFLSVGAFSLFSFLAVASWADSRRREREAYYRSETLKKAAESQAPGAAAVLELVREQDKKQSRQVREGLKLGGLVTAAVGIALVPLLRVASPAHGAYLVGLIPLLVGVAMLFYVYVLAPKE